MTNEMELLNALADLRTALDEYEARQTREPGPFNAEGRERDYRAKQAALDALDTMRTLVEERGA
ncbi:MAG: hypothetical protein M0R66_02250 [Candidatus Omnitrophica bacterium]|jgi:hypothetical protein|nr:hypothetical protein [Sphaerochaeta sp.]MCK9603190.1 hypothetical protein [Candidatus Omnitrophota bacterium]